MHWLSKEVVMVDIIYCLGVSVFGVQGKFHKECLRLRCCILHYLDERIHASEDVFCLSGALTVMGSFHSYESSSPVRV
eukprot:6027544-Ditylum_brightwellii.AAC.1